MQISKLIHDVYIRLGSINCWSVMFCQTRVKNILFNTTMNNYYNDEYLALFFYTSTAFTEEMRQDALCIIYRFYHNASTIIKVVGRFRQRREFYIHTSSDDMCMWIQWKPCPLRYRTHVAKYHWTSISEHGASIRNMALQQRILIF